MSTPTSPQGSPLEQAAKGNSLAAKITFITLAHLAVIGGGLVFYGCSKGNTPSSQTDAATNTPPAIAANTDPVVPGALIDTNSIVAPADPGAHPTGGAPVSPGVNPVVNNPLATAITPIPNSTPEPAPANTGAPVGNATASEYKVLKGDVGTTIAKKHGVSVAALKAANPAVNWSKLKVGQPIQIPAAAAAPAPNTSSTPTPVTTPGTSPAPEATEGAATVHVVKANDTLSSISRKYGVPWKQIRAANNLKSENIKVGDKLKIPAKKERHAGKHAAAAPADATSASTTSPANSITPIPAPAPEPAAQPLPIRPAGAPPR